MPSWLGPWEIVIIVVILLLVLGPKKLPELGSSLGKSITGFKRGLRESRDEFQAAIKDDGAAESETGTTASGATSSGAASTETPPPAAAAPGTASDSPATDATPATDEGDA